MYFLFLVIPFVLQGLAFGIDEFVYHHRRGLPLWERIGHPIDTASVIAPLVYVMLNSFGTGHLLAFAGMALGSCLLVTKDEFVHAELCEPGEQWLHSLLFVLHPLLFVTVGTLWYLESLGVNLIPGGMSVSVFLRGQVIFLTTIMVYQIVYWSIIWPRKQAPLAATRSTTRSTTSLASVGIARKTIP